MVVEILIYYIFHLRIMDIIYTHFQSASGKFVIEGPGLCVGDLILSSQEQTIIICSCLERAFKAGKKAKAKEIKAVFDDES